MKDDQDISRDNERPEEIIDEIENILDSLHTELTNDAIEVGQAKDSFKAIRFVWENLGNASTSDADIVDIYSTGTSALSSIRDDYKSIAQKYSPLHGLMGTISSSTNSAVNITSSTSSFVLSNIVAFDSDWLVPVATSQREKTKESLKMLSTDLADTYDAIWEVLYGTRKNPERGSLYLIRQVFDHLFGVLAPDNEVRASQFWHPKGGNEPNQVARQERIEYAAYTKVKNKTAAKRLVASTKHMLDVYKTLNKAHKRGKLDLTQARISLKEMQAIIEDWVQSLSLID